MHNREKLIQIFNIPYELTKTGINFHFHLFQRKIFTYKEKGIDKRPMPSKTNTLNLF